MLSWLAEQRIQEAMQRGEFKHLAGEGKSLEVEDLSHVPEELRVAYKIMKNAGVLPEELMLQGECLRLQDLIAACDDREEKSALQSRLTEKSLRLRMLLEQRGIKDSSVFKQYGSAIVDRIK